MYVYVRRCRGGMTMSFMYEKPCKPTSAYDDMYIKKKKREKRNIYVYDDRKGVTTGSPDSMDITADYTILFGYFQSCGISREKKYA